MVRLASKAMFGRLFALANPIKTDLELLQSSWESLLKTCENFDKRDIDKCRVEKSSIPGILSTILRLIQQDESKKDGLDSDFSCLDYFLQEKALAILVEHAKQDIPKGLRLEVTRFFSILISRHSNRILPPLTARKPLLNLIHSFLSNPDDDNRTREAHINLLLSLITTLNQNPGLLGLFTTLPTVRSRPSSALGSVTLCMTQTVVKAESFAPVQILLISLQNYICTSGSTGVHARGALFELIHLLSSDPESTALLIHDPMFKNIMLEQLNLLYSAMPAGMSTQAASEELISEESLNIQTPSDSNSKVDDFFELWKFTNKLLSTTNSLYPEISECILGSIIVPFLEDVVLESLFSSSTAIFCSRIMYYIEMLNESPSSEVYSVLLSLALDPRKDKTSLVNRLSQRICEHDDQASIVSLRLFDTLLATYHPAVYQTALPGLLSSSLKRPPNEALVKRFLGLIRPIKPDLNEDLKEYLELLNPSSSGHDDYFIESLVCSNKYDTKVAYLHARMAQSDGGASLPPLLTVLVSELQNISGRSHERIILLTGIIIRLIKLPSSRLLAEQDPNSPYSGFADHLCGLLTKGLVELETKMEELGSDVWDVQAIEGAFTETPSLSSTCSSPVDSHECFPTTPSILPMTERSLTSPTPMYSHSESLKPGSTKIRRSSSISNLYTAVASQTNNPSETIAPLPAQDAPSVDLLIYVAEAHRPLFLSYIALQESCKEMAAFLTVYYTLDRSTVLE
ncbi:hypothetical protein DSO57_1035092 [Entomophthora muscae]|uniref:Uncharacterized protein n=2 Tax=Entomophthora muscae TaxID=34485 RepID=A0ACC2S1K7_9FUNG|nr:hypothetical protein DSO57_1035091 [Entomophthora muscae]KAJ9056254.1 hypothetical protein DSO57_1035092 [Entomophthora muscae]